MVVEFSVLGFVVDRTVATGILRVARFELDQGVRMRAKGMLKVRMQSLYLGAEARPCWGRRGDQTEVSAVLWLVEDLDREDHGIVTHGWLVGNSERAIVLPIDF